MFLRFKHECSAVKRHLSHFSGNAMSCVLGLVGLLPMCGFAAEPYPTKSVRLIVPYPAGGPADLLARLIAQKLTEKWGQQVLVDNRGGANTIIGMDLTAKAPPDGYTFGMATTAMAINLGLVPALPYDTLTDFAPVTNLVYSSFILDVHPSLPVRSLKDLIALAKAHPGRLTYGSGGTGSPTHLSGELLETMAGIDMVHIPYKGMAPAITDLLGGQIQLLFSDPLVALPYVKAGRLRALAVTSTKRFPGASSVPTIAESGLPGYESGIWYGIVVPAKTPQSIIDKARDEIVKILVLPEVDARLNEIGTIVIGDTPSAFGIFIKSEISKWSVIAKRIAAPQQ